MRYIRFISFWQCFFFIRQKRKLKKLSFKRGSLLLGFFAVPFFLKRATYKYTLWKFIFCRISTWRDHTHLLCRISAAVKYFDQRKPTWTTFFYLSPYHITSRVKTFPLNIKIPSHEFSQNTLLQWIAAEFRIQFFFLHKFFGKLPFLLMLDMKKMWIIQLKCFSIFLCKFPKESTFYSNRWFQCQTSSLKEPYQIIFPLHQKSVSFPSFKCRLE